MLRNMITDYATATEVSPYEYIKIYIEKCPEGTEDTKLSWIAESFLGIQKHNKYLKEISSYMSNELSGDDQDFFLIIFHAITFQISPTDMKYLYKCLYNLSKPLLNTFTIFLSNNEALTYVSQVAQSYYDATFITEKIIGPLFNWQPYISEMAHTYAEYIKKIERLKMKPLTVPIKPNVLNRKSHHDSRDVASTAPIDNPPTSIKNKGTKMLTKSAIDKKLNIVYKKNKQRANELLTKVKRDNNHYAKGKSENFYKKVSGIQNETENEYKGPNFVSKKAPASTNVPTVKENTATVKRLNKRIQQFQKEEVQWLEDLVTNYRNMQKIEEMQEYDRQETERQRLLDIEKKHLMGLLSYEEALIARKKLKEENKKKYEDFIKEKVKWEEEIEKWQREELERNRKQVEKLSLLELNLLEARNNATLKKKEIVENVKKNNKELLSKAMKEKEEELERKINMIKELKILSIIAKKIKVPKIVDLTESSGIGLLCEMSIAELQERLNATKMCLKEELENKRKSIKEEKELEKNKLEETKSMIQDYIKERESLKKDKKRIQYRTQATSKEIDDLKKMLEEKRKIRQLIT
ncbi:unnamed protein product [Leptidea sinapis]|uniref:Cilia- and flagella-associated protein 99 n=2 Tax=Leptidea sinapis TaxID=189913 RepID=A0A5E4Q3G9_9NEOP|nr:unnamed protein product [Leptidea sinapis]